MVSRIGQRCVSVLTMSLHRVLFVLLWVFALACDSKDEKSEERAAAASYKDEKKEDKEAAFMPTPDPAMAEADEEEMGGAAAKTKADGKDGGKKGGEAKTWKRSVALANTSKLMIGDKDELPIKGMHLRSQVDGFRARVLIDFYFENDRDQTYEGTFKLRLPDGASPMFLAFGESKWEAPKYGEAKDARKQGYAPPEVLASRAASWIKPKVARMVQKEKASHAYSNTVRRAVDPALMEWAGAGVFNARIFPITPRKLHRVVVAYDMDLTAIGDDMELQIPIPEGVPTSAMDLNVASPKGVNVKVTPTAEKFPEGPRRFYRLDNIAGKTVTVRLQGANAMALTGRDAEAGKPFFATALRPKLPKTTATGGPQRAVFAVDTSMSSNPDRFNVWLKLLRAILDNNRKALPEFAVVFFNADAGWWQPKFVKNEAAQVDALIKYANTLALEGATDLAATLGEVANPPWADAKAKAAGWDVFLLSDGAATWGPAGAYEISRELQGGGARAVFAYKTGMPGGDNAMLNHVTRESGGAVFSVVGESEVEAASTAHRTRPWALTGITLDGAEDLLVAGRPRFIFPGQRLFVVGRGAPKAGAKVKLELSWAGKTSTVELPLSNVLESDLTPRSYGQVAVQQLEEFVATTEPQATAFARHFRVTGKTASLLMLDTEEDYRRYGIVPKDDANVVATQPVKPVLEAKVTAANAGDPKADFLARLQKLTRMPGVELKVPTTLDGLLRGLPSQAYEVKAMPLRTKYRGREGVSALLLEELSEQKPDYDTAVAEAEVRLKKYGPDDALKALSSMVERSPGDGVLARDIGFMAMSWGLHAQAFRLFTRVADARPYEPQTYRAMALSLAEAGEPDLALAYYEVALAGQWDERFGAFRQIVLQDYLRFLRRTPAKHYSRTVAEFAAARRDQVAKEVDVSEADIVVTITWNTDNTDVDLHVIEPSGEECYYSHNRTRSGGSLTRDVTQGYGPEMYVLPKAPAGNYQVRAKYFADDVNRASTRTKVYATITRNWGKPGEKTEQKVVTLETGKDMHDLMTVKVD